MELEEVFHLESVRVTGNDWVVRHDKRYFQVKAQARQYVSAKGKVTVSEWEDGRLQIPIAVGRWLGRRFPAASSSGRRTQGGHSQESNPAHSPSGSPLAAGPPLEQTSDPRDAHYHDGLACGFALSRSRNLDHPISEAGANWWQPKNNNSKLDGGRLWKSRFVEKSTKRTFPLRLEIRTHGGFPLYAQPRLLLENKQCTTTIKG